ncbi:MAG: hypothetical protein R2838_18690 [Caldilineaceae bacterium]
MDEAGAGGPCAEPAGDRHALRPHGVSLYFHTLNPFNGLVTMPVQLAAGLIVAYNSVVLLSWVLAGYGVFLLTTWVLAQTERGAGNRFAADAAGFVAGAIFTFASLHMAHLLGHMQVMSLSGSPSTCSFYCGVCRPRPTVAPGCGRRSWPGSSSPSSVFATGTLCSISSSSPALTLVWAGVRCLWTGRHRGAGSAVRRCSW